MCIRDSATNEVQEHLNEVGDLMDTLESLSEAVDLLWGAIDNAESFTG